MSRRSATGSRAVMPRNLPEVAGWHARVAWRGADDRLGGRRGGDHRPDRAPRRAADAPAVHCGGSGRRGRSGWRYAAHRPSAWPARWASRWPHASTRASPDAAPAAVHAVETARPTAVNLARGARRAAGALPDGPDAVLAEALRCGTRRSRARAAQGRLGADLLTELCGDRPPAADPLQHRRARRRGRRYRPGAPSPSCTGAARWPGWWPARPGRCCRGPGSPRGSWPSWGYRAGSPWTVPGRS